jgi:hypothetical protein
MERRCHEQRLDSLWSATGKKTESKSDQAVRLEWDLSRDHL